MRSVDFQFFPDHNVSCFLVCFAELLTHPYLTHFQDPLWKRLLPNAAGHAVKLSSLLEKKLFRNGCYPLDSLLAQCFPFQADFDPVDSSPVLILS